MNRAIIVAAGQGMRMQADRRKQFLALYGRPILTHTLLVFENCADIDQLIVVIPAEEAAWCRKNILRPAGLEEKVVLVDGGRRRQDSVYNGLESISADDGVVLIHDGVRPLVAVDTIHACIQGAREWGSCIPVILPVDTPKLVNAAGIITQTIDRRRMRMAQTPQAFQLPILRKAHESALQQGWAATDDASLVERMGMGVHTIPGTHENIKITTPQDLAMAEYYLSRKFSAEDGR